MAKYKVDITGVDTNKLKVLSDSEQKELFIKMHNGDSFAKEELIMGNLKLVLSVLKRFKDVGNMDDLFQVGVIGLIKAIDNFDLSYDLKLSTYAIPLILGEVKRHIRDSRSSLKIGRTIRDFAYQIVNYQNMYFEKYGHNPSNEELSKHFNTNIYNILNALDSLKEPISINTPIYNNGGEEIYLEDELSIKEDIPKEKYLLLKRSLLNLKEKERFVLVERYIVGRTQNELANILNVSQAQVSRIEKGALKMMNKLMK